MCSNTDQVEPFHTLAQGLCMLDVIILWKYFMYVQPIIMSMCSTFCVGFGVYYLIQQYERTRTKMEEGGGRAVGGKYTLHVFEI